MMTEFHSEGELFLNKWFTAIVSTSLFRKHKIAGNMDGLLDVFFI